MSDQTFRFATPDRAETGEGGADLLRHVSSVVEEIERLKAERQAEAVRAARAHLTVVYTEKRSLKRGAA